MRKKLFIAFVILIIAILLRVIDWKGFGALDDAEYARFAYLLSTGQYPVLDYNGPAVFPLRLGIILPTAIIFKVFGISEWSMVLFPFCLSLIGVGVAYYGGQLFFGKKAGIIAAILWAVIPIESFHATILVPDPPGALFANIAILIILFFYCNHQTRKSTYWIGGFAAGLFFGYSWLCKASMIYLFPFCLILLFWGLKDNFKNFFTLWLAATAGLFTVIVGEMLFYHYLTGDFLFRFHELERNIQQNPVAFNTESYSNAKALLKRWIIIGPRTILTKSQYLFLPFIALVGCFHALYRKDRSFLIPALWLISLILVFNFGSISLKKYIPLILFQRYLYPIFIPAVILSAGFIFRLLSRTDQPDTDKVGRARQFLAILLMIALAITAMVKNYKNITLHPNWTLASKEVSQLIGPEHLVYTDILTIQGLEFFWGYPNEKRTVKFEKIQSSDDINSGSFVLLNQTYLTWMEKKAGWWPTESKEFMPLDFYENVPENWQVVWEKENAVLYKVFN